MRCKGYINKSAIVIILSLFCTFTNGIKYPKLAKYVAMLKYPMTYQNTKEVIDAIEIINTQLYKQSCELTIDKTVTNVLNKPTGIMHYVELYVFTVTLDRPRVEVLQEITEEIKNCKSYSYRQIRKMLRKYFPKIQPRNPKDFASAQNDFDRNEFSETYMEGNFGRGGMDVERNSDFYDEEEINFRSEPLELMSSDIPPKSEGSFGTDADQNSQNLKSADLESAYSQ